MRAMAGLVVLGAVLATSACFGYQKVESAPRPGSRVRVVLASATDITTLAADSTRRAYAAVLEASGTIQAAAGDTMALRLGEVRTATGAIPGVAGQVALLPTDRIARIEERQFQAGRTALAGVGTATLALAVFLVVVISALTQGF